MKLTGSVTTCNILFICIFINMLGQVKPRKHGENISPNDDFIHPVNEAEDSSNETSAYQSLMQEILEVKLGDKLSVMPVVHKSKLFLESFDSKEDPSEADVHNMLVVVKFLQVAIDHEADERDKAEEEAELHSTTAMYKQDDEKRRIQPVLVITASAIALNVGVSLLSTAIITGVKAIGRAVWNFFFGKRAPKPTPPPVPEFYWCSPGNSSVENLLYSNLGKLQEIDKCCREHAHCARCVDSGKTRQYLYNNSSMTRFHCFCDEIFRECLQGITRNEMKAMNVMSQYFLMKKAQCFAEVVPCKPWTGIDLPRNDPGRCRIKYVPSIDYYKQTIRGNPIVPDVLPVNEWDQE